jgi:hypothetical protein
MNWKRLLTTPPPTTGWTLDIGRAAVVHRAGPEELHCAVEELPPAIFEIGPVGLQGLDSASLNPALARLKGAAEGTGTAAVVLPTNWLRSFLIDADRLPRKEEELHDVVRWRLKKLLPVKPNELRLSVVRLTEANGRRQLLVMVGMERALAAVEAAFRAIGVEPGFITTRLFALIPRNAGSERPIIVIQHESGLLSLVLIVNGIPRLLRTKPLPLLINDGARLHREVRLNFNYVREKLQLDGEIEVKLVTEDLVFDAEIRSWLAEDARLVPAATITSPPCGPATVADRLGPACLAPAVALVMGEIR